MMFNILADPFLRPTQKGLTITFCFLSPLLIPLFAYIYGLPISFLTWLFLGNSQDRYSEIISFFVIGICLLLAIITQIGLWRMFKVAFLKGTLEVYGEEWIGFEGILKGILN